MNRNFTIHTYPKSIQMRLNRRHKEHGLINMLVVFFQQVFVVTYFLLATGFFTITQAQNQEVNWNFHFYGNHHFNDKQIRQSIQLEDNTAISQNQLQQKLAQLIEIYHDDGYFAAHIDSVNWLKNTDYGNLVKIVVSERQPFRINRLFVFGNNTFSAQELRHWMRSKSGEVFYPGRLEQDVQQIINRYVEAGYLLVEVNIQKLDFDYNKSKADIMIAISEHHPVQLKRFEISGNHNTKKNVIVRELGMQPGDIVTETKIQNIQTRLQRLPFIGLQESPRIYFTKDSLAVISLKVEEQNSSQLNGVLGYNPGQGQQKGYVSGQLDLQFQNLLGTGRSFLAYWDKRGPTSQSLQLAYQEPWLFGLPLHGEFRFHQNVQDTSFVRRSWNIGLQVSVVENIHLTARVGQESVIPDSIGRVLYQLPRSSANHLYLEVGFDSRNHPWNPSSGLMYRTSVDFVRKRIQPVLANETATNQDFQRVGLDLEYVMPLFWRQVVLFGVHGQQVKIGDDVIPVDELFRLGGANNLRGYRDDQFLGSQVAWGTLEYRFLLERESRIGVFLDAAYIGRRTEDRGWNELYKIGYGFGLHTKTDLGIIGFDYGLAYGESFSQGKIHVRLINTF